MQISIDLEDRQAIANAVLEELKPLLLSSNDKSAEEEPLMTITETARFLNLYKKNGKVNIDQIYQWCNQSQHGLNNFPFLKAGKLLRFSKRDILKWLSTR